MRRALWWTARALLVVVRCVMWAALVWASLCFYLITLCLVAFVTHDRERRAQR